MWKSKKVFIRKFSLKVLYGLKGCRIQKGDKVAITNGKETFYKATVCGEGLIYDTEEIPEIYRRHWKQKCDWFYKVNSYEYVEISKEGEEIYRKIPVTSIKVKNGSIQNINKQTYEGL